MDGIKLLREIKENYSRTDVINITGYCDDYTLTDMVKVGASDFISKAVSFSLYSKTRLMDFHSWWCKLRAEILIHESLLLFQGYGL